MQAGRCLTTFYSQILTCATVQLSSAILQAILSTQLECVWQFFGSIMISIRNFSPGKDCSGCFHTWSVHPSLPQWSIAAFTQVGTPSTSALMASFLDVGLHTFRFIIGVLTFSLSTSSLLQTTGCSGHYTRLSLCFTWLWYWVSSIISKHTLRFLNSGIVVQP